MSNTGGDEGEGDTALPPHDFQVVDVQGTEPAAGIDDGLPPEPPAVPEQNADDEGTQDTTATEQPQQEGDQGAAPVRQAIASPPDTQSQGGSSGRAPSTSGTEPARTSGVWPKLTNWFGGKKKRSASTSTVGSTGNRPQRSNTSIPSGSRPVSLVEEPEPSGPIATGEDTGPPGTGAPSPELVGPSRRRLNSQGSISQRSANSPREGNSTGPRATRTDTGLSINTNVGFLQAIGGNEGPTPLGGPGSRPSPFGPRSAGGNFGSLPTTAVDPQLELTRRNRAFLGLYDQLRDRELVVDEQEFQTRYERVRDWRFLLDADELEQLANQGVAAVRDAVGAPAANIPPALQDQIIVEARRGTNNIRNAVTNALADERNFVVNTTNDIITLIDDVPAPRDRRRGSSRLSRAQSLASNASQPELPPMDPRALAGRSREDLVNTILAMEQRRLETDEYVARLEDEARQRDEEHPEALRALQAQNTTNERNRREEMAEIRAERDYFEKALRDSGADQARPGAVDPESSRDNSEEPPEVNGSGARADAAPISDRRQRALEAVTSIVQRMARGEALVRQLEIQARVDTTILDENTGPFSANAELSRAGLGIRLRDLTENNIQLTQELDETRENETQLLDRVAALERLQASPPRSVGGSLLGSLFGSNSERAESPPVNERSRSGSRAGPATPIRDLARELAAQGSGGSSGSSGSSESSGSASRQSAGSRRQSRASSRRSEAGDRQSVAGSRQSVAGSRQSVAGSRQSVAGSRQSNASSNNSGGRRTPPEGDPAAVNPAPLRAMPEWLAAHPNGPCDDCVPIFRFPPELGELPTCGCTCDLALRNPPPPAGRSPRAASSRSRGSTGSSRSVRFADDEPAAEGSGGRRPAPLDLAAAGNVEEDNADRPNTPYPADAEGGQAEGSVREGSAGEGSAGEGSAGEGSAGEGSAGEGSAGEGPAGEGPAPGEQGETVPIQAPTDQATGQEELLVEAPPVVAAPGGRGDGRCPCCGRGAYGEPPADGVRQVAFYICRNMAGQPVPRGPPNVFQGVINALGLAPVRPRPDGGDRWDEFPTVFPEPPVPGPQDRVMWYLTAIWYFIAGVCLLPLRGVRYSLTILLWFVAAFHSSGQYGLYLFERYIAERNFPCPTLASFPMWETFCLALLFLAVWATTIAIAIFEEVRIWKAANAQFTTAYLRGVAFRRPYPWYQLFEADPGLVWPALGWMSEWLHESYFP